MISTKLQDKERLLKTSRAAHGKTSRAARCKRIYGVGGKFFPTNQQLIFKSLLIKLRHPRIINPEVPETNSCNPEGRNNQLLTCNCP